MKKNFFFMAALLVAMTGCNKETEMKEKDSISPEDKVYMTFSIKTPTTRSATDEGGTTNSNANPDYEVGKDYENTISTVDIVLLNDNSYVIAEDVKPSISFDNKYIAAFNSLELQADTKYDVYIYANCDAPSSKDLDAVSNAAIADMTKNNSFWMTNAYAAKSVELPENMSIYTSPATPLNLGSHDVERSMARFDIMPYKDYDFEIVKDKLWVTLTEAAIVNQSVGSYLLRRTSADGTATNWEVGGVETPINYVVDTKWERKVNGWQEKDVIAVNTKEFLYPHMLYPKEWEWVELPTAGEKDNWEGVNGTDEHSLNDYYIWQYCKENTIPGIDNQQKGYTTCIVFKGIIDTVDGTLMSAMSRRETLYAFENILYGSWKDVKNAAEQPDAPASLVVAFNTAEAALKSQTDPNTIYPNAYSTNGFTGYSPDEKGNYYTYYYYWNRHNDNGDNATMGPMEFAVVRNNVYKLCVDNIYKLGHPTPGKDPDPDPEDPFDPDEDLNYYFNVTARVLPWTVRVNHIEF